MIEIIKEKTELEIQVDDKKYIRIWGANGCIEMNDAYHIQKYIPDFNGFTFDLLTEQQLGHSRIYMPIDYEDDDEKVYKTSM